MLESCGVKVHRKNGFHAHRQSERERERKCVENRTTAGVVSDRPQQFDVPPNRAHSNAHFRARAAHLNAVMIHAARAHAAQSDVHALTAIFISVIINLNTKYAMRILRTNNERTNGWNGVQEERTFRRQCLFSNYGGRRQHAHTITPFQFS